MAERRDILRWSVSCVTVLVCYAAAATAILAWEPHYETPTAPTTIAMIDLAPLPPEEPTPPPPAPPPPPEPEIVPEPPPEVKVEVPLPPVKKPPPPKVKREEPPPETPLPPVPTPPVESAAVPAPAPAPRIAARPDPSPNVLAMYSARVSAHVQRNLRYPLASLRRNERGTAYVLVTVNKSGKILSYKLETGTNRRLLDEEALAVVIRSDPMPAFPAEIDREEMELRLPVAFNIR